MLFLPYRFHFLYDTIWDTLGKGAEQQNIFVVFIYKSR